MTLQDLKDNRQEIIDEVNFKNNVSGNYVDLKTLMQSMVERVEFGMAHEYDSIEDFVSDVYEDLRPRSRKTSRVAESYGRAVEDGRIEEFDMRKYFANKNGYKN